MTATALPPLSDDLVTRLRRELGGIQVDPFGDNLAIQFCSEYDNPDQISDDDTGWTPDAIAGCDAALDAIHAHYAPTLTALLSTLASRDAALAVLVELVEGCMESDNPFLTDWDKEARAALADLPASAQALLEKHGWMEAQSNYFENECREWKERAETAEAKVVVHLEGHNAAERQIERLEAKIATLERSQRTPGMVEVCENYNNGTPGYCTNSSQQCPRPGCPIAALKPGKDQV